MIGLFVGDGTLLIQCAEAFRTAGGQVGGIATSEPRIRAWAEAEGLTLAGTPGSPAPADAPFDYLFSVANLTVLPDALLARARRAAINFHDGPLPAYSGLNVPAWAIMAGEPRHAVTWHEMATRVDAGRILKVRPIEIADDETTFSLNAKCYEAGLAAFVELVDDIVAGRLEPREQSGARKWFGRARRPSNLGLLDFSEPADVLSARVRGLDYGAYRNPLALAKVWTGGALISVGRVAVAAGPASAAPGRVVAVDADGLRVAAADADVVLSGLHDLAGAVLAPDGLGLGAGGQLPALPQLAKDVLEAVGRVEADWAHALAMAHPAEPPHQAQRRPGRGAVAAPLALARLDRDVATAGFAGLGGAAGRARYRVAGARRAGRRRRCSPRTGWSRSRSIPPRPSPGRSNSAGTARERRPPARWLGLVAAMVRTRRARGRRTGAGRGRHRRRGSDSDRSSGPAT